MRNKDNGGMIGLFIGLILTGVSIMMFMTLLVDRIVTPDEIYRSQNICESANSSLAWFEINANEIEVTCKSGATFIINTDPTVTIASTIKTEENLKNGDSYE